MAKKGPDPQHEKTNRIKGLKRCVPLPGGEGDEDRLQGLQEDEGAHGRR